MRIYEICDMSRLEALGLYSPSTDKLGQRELADTRHEVISLGDINRLKRARSEEDRLEAERLPEIARQYGSPDAEQDDSAVEKAALDVTNKRLQVAKSVVDLRKKKVELASDITSRHDV
jgi:hypothetical protein